MSTAPDCVLIGGGGHARVVIDSLQAAGETRTLGIVDADAARRGKTVLGVPILGDDSILPALAASGTKYFAVTVGSVGDANLRRALFERACALGLLPLGVRHPSAIISQHADVGSGTQLLPGAIVNAGARLGANVIVNSGAIVEHDCEIGDHAHVATGARIASGVTVGEGVHVGAGATVRQLLRIGAGAIVGAGAVVVKDVSARSVVVGVPAARLQRYVHGSVRS